MERKRNRDENQNLSNSGKIMDTHANETDSIKDSQSASSLQLLNSTQTNSTKNLTSATGFSKFNWAPSLVAALKGTSRTKPQNVHKLVARSTI